MPYIMPGRFTWTTTFHDEMARAVTGLAVGFFTAFMLWYLSLAMHGMDSPYRDPVPVPVMHQVATAISFASGMMLWGCVIAALPMIGVMTIERLARLDLGAGLWTCIGLFPTSLLAAAMLGGDDLMTGPAMSAGGVAALVAYASRRSTGRGMKVRTVLATITACIGILVLSCGVATQLPVVRIDSDRGAAV